MTYREIIKKAFVACGYSEEKADRYATQSDMDNPECIADTKQEVPPDREEAVLKAFIQCFQNPELALKLLQPTVDEHNRKQAELSRKN